MLLEALQRVGAGEQVVVLAKRAAAHVNLDHPQAVAILLKALQHVGASRQVTVLLRRLPAAGEFATFLWVCPDRDRFRFGREPDGRPAPRWSWEDLE